MDLPQFTQGINNRSWKSNSGLANTKASNLATSNSGTYVQDSHYVTCLLYFPPFIGEETASPGKLSPPGAVSRTEPSSPDSFSLFPPRTQPPEAETSLGVLLTRSLRPKTVTWPRACSLRCRHSTRLRPLSMGSVTFLLPTVGLTVPASRWGSVCRATSMPLASSSRREPSAPM